MSNIVLSQASKLAESLGVSGEGYELANTLKATAFKGQVSDAQMAALLIVASQYKLNPWTKEIYAFPDRQNGIVPVVGVDGWARIINSHPQFDGMEFEQDDQACTCIMYRKDRSRPVRVTEFMAECRREGVGPWKSHPRRMLRHKAMIQCARLAFGFGGIYDQDEAERINEAAAPTVQHMGASDVVQEPSSPELVAKAEAAATQGLKSYQQFWGATVPTDRRSLTAGGHHERLKRAAADADAARTVEAVAPQQAARGFDEVLRALCSATTEDELYEAGASLHEFAGDDGKLLDAKFQERLAQIRGEA